MKRATFNEGVGIALVSSIVIAAVFFMASFLFFGDELFRFVIAAISFFYILYLLLRTNERVGRVVVLSLWFVLTLMSLIFIPSLIMFIVFQLTLIWLLRSLYFYNSLFSALIDLMLNVLSLIIAIWTWSVSGSLFLTFWCFFIVQALFVFIPKTFASKSNTKSIYRNKKDKFEQAHHEAELAIAKLINSNY